MKSKCEIKVAKNGSTEIRFNQLTNREVIALVNALDHHNTPVGKDLYLALCRAQHCAYSTFKDSRAIDR
jgi:hypothetical protein